VSFFLAKEVLYLIFSPIFISVVLLCYLYNRHVAKKKSKLYEFPIENIGRKTIKNVCFAMIVGIAASAVIVWLGVDITAIGLEYLWIWTLLFAGVHLRLVCFSYSGAVVGLLSVVDVIQIDVAGLLAIIGILHMAEGILVWLDGANYKQVVYIKKKDTVVAGYLLETIWPMPLILLATGMLPLQSVWEWPMAQWWPLYSMRKNEIFALLPAVALLAYSDMTTSMHVKQKIALQGKNVLFYGAILLVLSLGVKKEIFASVIVICMPILHEGLIRYGNFVERRGAVCYSPSKEGILVLECTDTAKKLGLQEGDIILDVNNVSVETRKALKTELASCEQAVIQYRHGKDLKRILCVTPEKFDVITTPAINANYDNFSGIFYLPRLLLGILKSIRKKRNGDDQSGVSAQKKSYKI